MLDDQFEYELVVRGYQSATWRLKIANKSNSKVELSLYIFQEILTTIKNTSLRKENCKQPSPVD